MYNDDYEWKAFVEAIQIGNRERTEQGRVARYSLTNNYLKLGKFDTKRRITLMPMEMGKDLIMRVLEDKNYVISGYNQLY
jgi:hypothetical protein